MRKFNTVTVAQVRSLEAGDLIAKEFLGDVVSGRVTGMAYFANDLTPEMTKYMREQKLEIPQGRYDLVAGEGYVLLFGEFVSFNRIRPKRNHMCLRDDILVAVFPNND